MKKHLFKTGVVIAAFLCGSYFGPKKVEVKEVEKIVYKESTDSKINSKRTIDKKETILPDGSKVIETKTKIERTTDKKSNKELDQNKSSSRTTESRPTWRLGVTHYPELPKRQDKFMGFDIQRRIFSEVYLGVSFNTKHNIGFSLSVGF